MRTRIRLLAQEIRVRITEGAAEQSSRLKDANEKITAVDAKLENLKREALKRLKRRRKCSLQSNKVMKNSLRSKKTRTVC